MSLLVACSMLPVGDVANAYTIHVDNGTTLPVDIVVNGTPVAHVAPNSSVALPPSAAGPRPWEIHVVTRQSRREIVSFEVVGDDVDIDGPEQLGRGTRADLSCGRLDVYVGPPLMGPAPGPGQAGDYRP
ncbi:MAG TPA: hypothetical protein VGK16_16335 [Candidatus Limnocylindrales bacterium]